MIRRLRNGGIDPTTRTSASWALRAVRTPTGPATVLYRTDGPGRVAAEAWGPGAADAVAAAAGVLGIFDRPEALVACEPVVAAALHLGPAPRLGRSPSLVELLVPIVLQQKVQTVAAHRSYAWLCRRFGGVAPGPHGLLLPPDPERLATVGYEAFHRANVERKRADTIARLCRLRTSVDALPHGRSAEEVRVALGSIGGVGPWTAALATLLGCGDPDAVVVGDYHLPDLVAWAFAGERKATDERMLELLEPYAGQRARVQLLVGRVGGTPPRRGPKLSIRDIRDS